MLQDQQIDLENVDRNLLQQLIMAQQQMQQQPVVNQSRPRKTSSKKRPPSYKPPKAHQQSVQPKMKTISGYSDRPPLSNKKKVAKKGKKRPGTAQPRQQQRVPQH